MLSVDGQVATPTPCYAISGHADIANDTLFVRMIAKSTLSSDGACEEVVQLWHYTAAVNSPPSSVAVLRVTYDPGNGKVAVLLTQPLTAP